MTIVTKHYGINTGPKENDMAASAEEYNRKYHEEMQRHGTTRDEAVRRTNKALGYGDSTALQHEVSDEPPAQKPEPKD